MKHYPIYFISCLLLLLGLSSCFKEQFRDSSDTFVQFSRDTLAFDTVFTTVGSATRSIKIYNPYNQSLLLDKVYLEDKAQGKFRLNIDGFNGNTAKNVEIGPQDSIYIFGEVTVDPNDPIGVSPFIIEDYIRLEVNGNEQSVLLSAWGQNANYIPSIKGKGGAVLLCNDFNTIVFDDPKPYVIYGVLVVDTCTMVLPPGADIYVHGGVVTSEDGAYSDGIIFVGKDGKLLVEGTLESPVTIQGDRLEQEYDDVPGQWAGIFFQAEAKGSSIRHAIIKNSIIGLRVDSLAELDVYNTVFSNQSSSGLLGFHAKQVYLENCLFERCGGNSVNFAYGGNLEMNYCTISNYDSPGSAIAVSNYRCIEPTCLDGYLINPVNVHVRNSILVGDNSDQVILVDITEEDDFDYAFDQCIVQVDELLDNIQFADFFAHCNGCLQAVFDDTLFVDRLAYNYMLDTMSIAENRALPLSNITTDILERQRDSVNPDIGCYEFQD